MFLLKYVTKYCVNLRCRAYQFDTFVYCNLIAIAVTTNTSITSHNYHFFLVFGIIMFVNYWKFDGSTLLAIFTILCIRSIGLIYYSLQICASVLSPHPLLLVTTILLSCFDQWLFFQIPHISDIIRYLSFSAGLS